MSCANGLYSTVRSPWMRALNTNRVRPSSRASPHRTSVGRCTPTTPGRRVHRMATVRGPHVVERLRTWRGDLRHPRRDPLRDPRPGLRPPPSALGRWREGCRRRPAPPTYVRVEVLETHVVAPRPPRSTSSSSRWSVLLGGAQALESGGPRLSSTCTRHPTPSRAASTWSPRRAPRSGCACACGGPGHRPQRSDGRQGRAGRERALPPRRWRLGYAGVHACFTVLRRHPRCRLTDLLRPTRCGGAPPRGRGRDRCRRIREPAPDPTPTSRGCLRTPCT